MVSTVFAMPQAMDINLPPADEQNDQVEVKESNLLTIRVDAESRYWWNLKRTSPENLPQLIKAEPGSIADGAYKVDSKALRDLLVERNRENDKLSTLVLINKEATYSDMVDLLDEIDLIERSWNAAIAEQLGKKAKDLTREDGKFSYRYAIGDWEDRDDRIISAALENAIAQGELNE
jgi:biopolymer transport protein ExbD